MTAGQPAPGLAHPQAGLAEMLKDHRVASGHVRSMVGYLAPLHTSDAGAGALSLFSHGSVSFLPDRDYLPMAMPTTGFDVLWILTRNGGTLRRFGILSDVLVAQDLLPTDAVRRDEITANAAGTVTKSAKAGLSLGIVNAILTALGGKAGLDLSATGAHSVEYAYTDVTADAVNLARLDAWLSGADLAHAVGRVADLLVAERLYMVVASLKAAALTSKMRDEKGTDLKVDVPVVQQLVGGGITVSGSSGRANELTFHGSVPLTIAAKVAQLKVDERGFWINEEPVSEGEIRGLSPGVEYLSEDEIRLS